MSGERVGAVPRLDLQSVRAMPAGSWHVDSGLHSQSSNPRSNGIQSSHQVGQRLAFPQSTGISGALGATSPIGSSGMLAFPRPVIDTSIRTTAATTPILTSAQASTFSSLIDLPSDLSSLLLSAHAAVEPSTAEQHQPLLRLDTPKWPPRILGDAGLVEIDKAIVEKLKVLSARYGDEGEEGREGAQQFNNLKISVPLDSSLSPASTAPSSISDIANTNARFNVIDATLARESQLQIESPPARPRVVDGLGLGKELFNLRLSSSKFTSAFSRYDTSDHSQHEASEHSHDLPRCFQDDDEEEDRRRRRPGGDAPHRVPKLRLHADGTLRCGPFIINENGIQSPERFKTARPWPFRAAFVRLEVLGRGASGEVYKAVHIPSMTLVAAKSIYYNDITHHHDFENELMSMCVNRVPLMSRGETATDTPAAPCPCLVSFHDAYLDTREDCLTLIMEHMDGGTLQDIADTGGCKSESVLANVAFQLLKALEYLHANRIIHRDIKPANILLDHEGHVKLSDFGVARVMSADVHGVKSNLGTAAYQSPERLGGFEYSFPADIWSLGLCLISVLQGDFPIPQRCLRSYFALLDYLESYDIPLPENISPMLADFLTLTLQRDPAARATATELLHHPFIVSKASITRFPSDSSSNSQGTQSKASMASMADLKYIASKVQRYRVHAALASMTQIPKIPQALLTGLAKQLSLPVGQVSLAFNRAQVVLENQYRRALPKYQPK